MTWGLVRFLCYFKRRIELPTNVVNAGGARVAANPLCPISSWRGPSFLEVLWKPLLSNWSFCLQQSFLLSLLTSRKRTDVEARICWHRYGYLTSQQSQLIHNQVAELCGELRPQALHLVDSFGIPQPFLGTLAFDWVESNSSFLVESFAPWKLWVLWVHNPHRKH